jgi:hypothetical protein
MGDGENLVCPILSESNEKYGPKFIYARRYSMAFIAPIFTKLMLPGKALTSSCYNEFYDLKEMVDRRPELHLRRTVVTVCVKNGHSKYRHNQLIHNLCARWR